MKKKNSNLRKEANLKSQLREISYLGKDQDFLNNPVTIILFKILLSLYIIAERFFNDMPFVRMYGTFTCKDVAKQLKKIVELYAREAFTRKRKHADFMFKCVDFNKLINSEAGVLTYNRNIDLRFWRRAAKYINLKIEGNKYEFHILSIFHVIDKIEKRLRIKGIYRKTFIRLPRGNVIAEGNLYYGNWKEMRHLGSILKGKEVTINFNNGNIYYDNGKIETNQNLIIYKERINASLLANQFRYLYGNCKFLAIDDSERNMRYIFITNSAGRVIKIEYFESWISNVKDLYLEVNRSKVPKEENDILSNYEDEILEEFIETPLEKSDILRTVEQVYTEINGLKGNFYSAYIKTIPFHFENPMDIIPVKPRKVRKGKLIKRFVTPLCKDGCLPTIMAANNSNPCWYNTLSTGHRPHPAVIEIWETDNFSVKKMPKHPIQRWVQGGILIERKYEGYLLEFTKDLDYFNGRKISNSNMKDIITAIRDLKPNQYVVERALTPQEALRIMGVPEEGINILCRSRIPSNQLKKMAGNSIVVPVLEKLIENMLIPKNLRQPDIELIRPAA
ncbi:MAG: DNA cytosine methyltransferase [Muribaculaceae bacterium]|nr:DNA cytosine methyltransferase [Muribaculaceae bacterium]